MCYFPNEKRGTSLAATGQQAPRDSFKLSAEGKPVFGEYGETGDLK